MQTIKTRQQRQEEEWPNHPGATLAPWARLKLADKEIAELRAALAKQAEAAPIVADERAWFDAWWSEFEAAHPDWRYADSYAMRWNVWQARAALDQRAARMAASTKGTTMQRIHDSDSAIESEIQAKGLTAPRVTPERIKEVIASEHYFTAEQGAEVAAPSYGDKYPQPLSLLTFCVLVLKNGFTVTGESACANPENFDADLGRKTARENAVNKIWALEGYLLKEALYVESVIGK